MKISTKGRYGLKAFMVVANSDDRVSLRNISEEIGVSENYLEQLMASLKKDGFVKSIRGVKGGYVLNCDINITTVGDILRCLEGTLAPVECLVNNEANCCGDASCSCCNTKNVWETIYNKVNEAIDNIYLKDLMDI